MKEKLKKLHEYLVSNHYTQDASSVEMILEEYSQNNGLSDFSKKDYRLCAILDTSVACTLKNLQIRICGGISSLK